MQTKSTNGNQRTMKTSELVRRFLPYFRPYRGMLALDLFCAMLTTLCDLVLPMIVRSITGLASGSAAALTVVYVLKVGGVYVLLRLIDTVANYIMVARGHVMGTYIERDMRHALFEHLQEMGFAYYSNAKVGQIMARITSDLFDVTEFAHHCPEEFLIAAIKITVPFVILLGINPVLTLIIFLMLPIMLVLARHFNKKMRAAFKESRHQVGEINAQVEDSLLGIRVVKSFANEPMEIDKFDRGNEEFVRIGRRKYRYMAGYNTTTRSFDGIMYIVVVIVGALFIIDGKITAADYMAYLLYISTLLTSIRRVVDYAEQFQRGMTGIERFFEIMDVPCEINVLVTDDAGIRAVNAAMRKIDRETDVLSFPMFDLSPGAFPDDPSDMLDPQTGLLPLGDMCISLERAKDQAKRFGNSLKREVGYLTIHSVLHLLGYDHMDEGEMKRQMRTREELIAAQLGLQR